MITSEKLTFQEDNETIPLRLLWLCPVREHVLRVWGQDENNMRCSSLHSFNLESFLRTLPSSLNGPKKAQGYLFMETRYYFLVEVTNSVRTNYVASPV